MVLFKKKAQRRIKDAKIVGAQLPSIIHEYLALYALANRTTKSRIIVMMLDEWKKRTSKNVPEQHLIDKVIKEVNSMFKKYKTIPAQRKYIAQVKEELVRRGLADNVIKEILRNYD